MDLGLTGRIAIVTGAASGIGRAVTLRLVQEGMYVLIADIDTEAGRETERLAAGAGKAEFSSCDVTDPASIRTTMKVANRQGRVWGLVNAAFVRPPEVEPEDISIGDWSNCFAVNVTGSLLWSQAVFADMRHGGGRIVNLGSQMSEHPLPNRGTLAPAKGAIRSLTRALATDWGRYGITINTVIPIAITPITERWNAAHPKIAQRRLDATPMKRLGDPDRDVAPVVAFILSAEAGWITGCTFSATGGAEMI